MASIIQENEMPTENESAELSVDALEETNITEDVSSTTQTPDPAKSASAVTGVHKKTETVPIVTEVTEPVETTAPVSQVIPEDNEVHEETETVPIATEVTEPVETTSPVSQILPGDNWETPDL